MTMSQQLYVYLRFWDVRGHIYEGGNNVTRFQRSLYIYNVRFAVLHRVVTHTMIRWPRRPGL